MAGEPIQVDGLRPLIRELKKINDELPNEVKAINRVAAEDVAGVARGLVPRGRTGNLAATIRVGATRRSSVVTVGTRRVPYAPVIHWGWPRHGIRAQPFMIDALDRRRDAIVESYESDLQTLIDRVFVAGTGGE